MGRAGPTLAISGGMTTLLTGTLERTVGWFHPRAHVRAGTSSSGGQCRRSIPRTSRRSQARCTRMPYARAARHSAGPAPPPVVLRRLPRARLHHGHRRTADVPDLPALFSRDVGMGAWRAAASGQVLSGLVVMHDAECRMHNRIAQPRGGMRNSRGRSLLTRTQRLPAPLIRSAQSLSRGAAAGEQWAGAARVPCIGIVHFASCICIRAAAPPLYNPLNAASPLAPSPDRCHGRGHRRPRPDPHHPPVPPANDARGRAVLRPEARGAAGDRDCARGGAGVRAPAVGRCAALVAARGHCPPRRGHGPGHLVRTAEPLRMDVQRAPEGRVRGRPGGARVSRGCGGRDGHRRERSPSRTPSGSSRITISSTMSWEGRRSSPRIERSVTPVWCGSRWWTGGGCGSG